MGNNEGLLGVFVLFFSERASLRSERSLVRSLFGGRSVCSSANLRVRTSQPKRSVEAVTDAAYL